MQSLWQVPADILFHRWASFSFEKSKGQSHLITCRHFAASIDLIGKIRSI